MKQLVALRFTVQRFIVWRRMHPGDAALVFDLAVIAVGMAAVAVASLKSPGTDEQSVPLAENTEIESHTLNLKKSTSAESKRHNPAQTRHVSSFDPPPVSHYAVTTARPSRHTPQRVRIERPVVPDGFYDAQFRLIDGNVDPARERFANLAEAHPEDAATLYHLALALYRSGRQEEAREAAVRGAGLERRHGLPQLPQ